MTMPLSLLGEEEIKQAWPVEEESGFGALHTSRGYLPLTALDVQAQLEGLLSQVEVCQTFVNNFDEPLEATYIFPLPDRAAVTRFRMDVGDRVVEGVLQERGQARRTYDVAVKQGHRAAIAEEERPGVFTLRVGNLMPGEQARIRLTLSAPLLYDTGEVTFRFPLVVAPRYIPGKPLEGDSVGSGTTSDTDLVPDASRISPPILLPGYPNPVRLSLSVDVLAPDLPVGNFRCSLHSASLEQDDLGRYHIELLHGERLNRDFILRYSIGDNALRSSLVLTPDHPGTDAGTFLLTLMPPLDRESLPRPRDVIFVLDRSGSMMGWKMVAARRALAHMVDTLTASDRFTVYAFDDHIEAPPTFGGDHLVHATDRNRYRAIEWLLKVDARGGTELAKPLDRAVKQLAGDRERHLVLITDGQVGNEDHILKTLGKRLGGIRIFTLGIDQAVNEAFLKRLAQLGGGFCDVVESEDRLDEVTYKLHRRINSPVLSNVQLDVKGLELEAASLTPGRKLDLFAGVPLLLQGRYRGAPEGAIMVQATDDTGRPWNQKVAGRRSTNSAVGVTWAKARLRQLEDRYVVGDGDRNSLERQIVEVSLKFGVLCRFTAFVAVDRVEVVNEGGKQHQVTQAVEAPAGWEMLAPQAPVARGSFGVRNAPLRGPAAPVPCSTPPPAAPAADVDEDLGDEAESLAEEVLYMADEAPPASASEAVDSLLEKLLHESAPRRETPHTRKLPAKKQGPGAAKQDRSAKKPGFFSRMFGGDKAKKEEPKEATLSASAVDLSAYRQRAATLLKALHHTGGGSSDRLRALGVLSVKLGELLDDMATIDVDEATLKPLATLHAELKKLVSGTPDVVEVQRLWELAEKTLTAFASPAVPAQK